MTIPGHPGPSADRKYPPPLPPAVVSAGPEAPLSELHFVQVRAATARRLPVRNAAQTARTSAIVTLVIGVGAVFVVMFAPSLTGFLVAAGLCAVGVAEFLGYRRMRRADPSAARWLGTNQLAFLGLITLYCIVQIATFSAQEVLDQALSPELQSLLVQLPATDAAIRGPFRRLAPIVVYGFYSLVIVLSIGFQGGLAWYYFTRKKHVEAFNRQTPEWIRRLFVEMDV